MNLAPPPPRFEDLTAGAKLVAALGFSTILPSFDFETYSEAGYVWSPEKNKWSALPGAAQERKGLPIVGAAAYAEHETTEVICLAYDLRDGLGKRHWRPGLPPPLDLFAYLARGGLISGWNVSFEQWIWNKVCTRRYGWPVLNPLNLIDAMAKARSHALPGSLEEVGNVLNLKHRKDPEGDRLMKKFSMPQNPTKKDPRRRVRCVWTRDEVEAEINTFPPHLREKMRPLIELDFVDTWKYKAYNDRDIEAEAEANSLVPDMNEQELRYWRNDQAINLRGVQIDEVTRDACIAIVNEAIRRYTAELEALAGCKPTELKQLQGWLHAKGVHMDALDEDAIDEALTKWTLPPDVRRALEIRAAVGSASVKKVFAMKHRATRAGRLHDTYVWHGARTGRPTGEGVQSTNLPKAGPDVYRCGWHEGKPTALGGCGHYHGAHRFACPWCGKVRGPDKPAEWSPGAMEDAITVIRGASFDLVKWFFGDVMRTVAGILRGLFIAKPGHKLVSSDFSAIEGVVIAALAGEQWRLDVFAGHGRIYEMSAAKILGISFDDMMEHKKRTGQHHPARQNPGKIAELGLGFGGWINAWKQFDGPGTDEEIKANILAWREASPMIVQLWGGQKIKNPHGRGWIEHFFGLEGACVQAIQYPGKIFSYRGIKYMLHDDVLYCRLLSGRRLTYHKPRLGQTLEDWRGHEISFEGWNSNQKVGPVGWLRMKTYSGKLAENVVQATARDIQMNAIEKLELAGYHVVMHTYDEVVAEVPEGFGSVEELERIMCDVPEWAKGWPIKAAGGWMEDRYRKA